jgi:hypothetical protein
MALLKRPWAGGATSSRLMEMPPALSPKIVTSPGSPPKAAMLRFTHSRAAIWSIRP